MVQFVDPDVTRVKFKREIEQFKTNANVYRKMGILCIGEGELSIDLIFSVSHLKPQPIAFAVRIDYTNWDAEPPSVSIIDPFSGKKLERKDVKIQFLQVTNRTDWKDFLDKMKKNQLPPNSTMPAIDLLQDQASPFFCIPGIKEYHDHAAHSGDTWMKYRTRGEGKLYEIINQLYKHSIAQSSDYKVLIKFEKLTPGAVSGVMVVDALLKELNIWPDYERV